MPLLVYLDSQDYSNLSTRPDLLAELLQLRDSGIARYIYSSAIISECAPTTASATRFAVDRTKNISTLCGRKTFISIDRIFELEFSSLRGSPITRDDLISENGDWFHSTDSLLSPIDRARAFDEVLVEKSLNRKQRRTVRSQTMRNGSFRSEASASILAGADETLTQLISAYPMPRKNAEILINYIAGTATRSQADNAMRESLREPHCMMQWFDRHSDKLSFVSSFIRAPSVRAHEQFQKSIDLSKEIDLFPSTKFDELIDKIIVETATKNAPMVSDHGAYSLDYIADRCRGFFTFVRTIRNFVKDSIGQSNRQIRYSDFADAIHSLHAPYVDVFRADKYMANKISTHGKADPIICARLEDLSSLIRRHA